MTITLLVIILIVSAFAALFFFSRNPNLAFVPPTDGEMNAAIQTARSTVSQFIAALKTPTAGQADFSVKKCFSLEKGGGEHIWLEDVIYDGTLFLGKVANQPEFVKTIKFGDTASVRPDEISDWKYVDYGKLKGGYTIRVLLNKMPENQRKQFASKLPFRIE